VQDRRDGGDGRPLRWSSLMRQIASTPEGPLYCYERQVDNRSDREVTDVYWPAADFRRAWIDKMTPICDPVSILGPVKQPDPMGPLSYNTGTNSYATTVRAPSTGWQQLVMMLDKGPAPVLTSRMQVPVRGAGAATIAFTSSVRREGATAVFHFEIANNGPDVRVFWNVPIGEGFAALEFVPAAPQTVGAGRPFARDIRSTEPVAFAVADVHVYSREMVWLGSGVASAYVSLKGTRQTPINVPPSPPRGRG